ncbi:hypothetical protein LOK49_LG05G00678 [Camellia lanceoleosa]|uniref:Uncharacterized protein n=1 Tax=Camellia lanceoleosa TaxID=1840588 RepID=A0ACC0HMQ4_9ERIC|nr:hypothetical protein LOK49_LG05G00678 [Camellia lanceoleosa]
MNRQQKEMNKSYRERDIEREKKDEQESLTAGWSHEEAYGQCIEVKWREERKCTNFQNRKELQFDIFEAYLPVFSLL